MESRLTVAEEQNAIAARSKRINTFLPLEAEKALSFSVIQFALADGSLRHVEIAIYRWKVGIVQVLMFETKVANLIQMCRA